MVVLDLGTLKSRERGADLNEEEKIRKLCKGIQFNVHVINISYL